MGKHKNAYEETEQEEARYEKLHHKNQVSLGACIVFALLRLHREINHRIVDPNHNAAIGNLLKIRHVVFRCSLTVAMVIALMQDATAHSTLRLPIIGTGLLGMVFCGFGISLNRKVQQYG